MIKAARKHGVKLDAPKPAKMIRTAIPIWYHVGKKEGNSVANTTAARCLREVHGVVTVLDAQIVAKRLGTETEGHRMRPGCECKICALDRVMGCDNPGRCAEAARKALQCLNPVWALQDEGWRDGLSLTRRRKTANGVADARQQRITFDPGLTDGDELANIFRVFDRAQTGADVEVYTDGSAEGNGEETARAGSGVWFGKDDPQNRAVRAPGGQTNQAAELFAVAVAAEGVPPFVPMHVVSDSRYRKGG
ncbi:hypothetical protein C8T65DRAFT_710367 [Cerioporus squamosus]|nr:hypothetical protein C8T65DRAFT_710367 [Cerioporus squamosus]